MNELKDNIIKLLENQKYKVFIRNSGKYKFPSNHIFETHNHPEIEINFINSGCCIMGVGDMFVPLKRGDCIMINPYISHCFMVDVSKSCSITQLEYCVSIPKELKDKIPAFDLTKDFFKFKNCEDLCSVMENICRSFRIQKENDNFSASQLDFALAQLYSVLSFYITNLEKEESGVDRGRVGKVIQYINDNLESNLDLEEISHQCQVSSRYVRKYFSEHMGMNCTQYITMLRIAKAKEMLWNTNKNITEIALQMGFNSSQYFSRVFHKHTDMTPLEYRQLWKGTKAKVQNIKIDIS